MGIFRSELSFGQGVWMIISDLEFYLVEIPCEEAAPVRTVLVRLAADTGEGRLGEASLDWRPGELDARRDALLPVLTGRKVFDIEELLTLDALRPVALRLGVGDRLLGPGGPDHRQPLCHLFGGGYRQRNPRGRVWKQRRPTRRPILPGKWRPKDSIGDRQLQWPNGTRPETIATVREHTGERTELSLDAAGNYDMETNASSLH